MLYFLLACSWTFFGPYGSYLDDQCRHLMRRPSLPHHLLLNRQGSSRRSSSGLLGSSLAPRYLAISPLSWHPLLKTVAELYFCVVTFGHFVTAASPPARRRSDAPPPVRVVPTGAQRYCGSIFGLGQRRRGPYRRRHVVERHRLLSDANQSCRCRIWARLMLILF